MPNLARVVSVLLAVGSPALAQSTTAPSRPFTFSVGLGPSNTFRGVDSRGVAGQLAIAHPLGLHFGLRLEGTAHWYEQQPLYPCLVQDAVRCYQTMRRAVGAGVLNLTYHLTRFASQDQHTVPYVISGLGIYRSRRIATHYPDCPPQDLCADRGTYKLEFRDTQLGWSGGLGVDFNVGPIAAFSEMRLHYMYNDKRGAQPSNDYFLWPLSIGLRF